MVRFAIIGVVVGVALVLYALVDAAMSDPARARGVSKPVWVVMIVLLPVIGALLWLFIGKARGPAPTPTRAPDDDPRFIATRLSASELDAHVEELEARLRELDDEVFPEVDPEKNGEAAGADGAAARSNESGRETTGGSEPGGSAKPGGVAKPGGAAKPGGSAKPGGAAKPGGVAKPESDASGEQR